MSRFGGYWDSRTSTDRVAVKVRARVRVRSRVGVRDRVGVTRIDLLTCIPVLLHVITSFMHTNYILYSL